MVTNIHNVTFTIEGSVFAAQEFDNWPLKNNNKVFDFWTFEDSSHLHLKGDGVIDGQGFQWWVREFMI